MNGRERVVFEVSVDLDAVPGVFNTADSAITYLRNLLNQMIPHYKPEVVFRTAVSFPPYRDVAIAVTPKNMEEIKARNGGMELPIRNRKTYFIVSDDPHKMNLVLNESQFDRCFRWITHEIPGRFAYVEEIV